MYVVDIRCDHRNSVATQGFKEFIDGQHRAGWGNGEPGCHGITETLIEIETEPQAEVLFHPMMPTCASASRSPAASMVSIANWFWDLLVREISVTRSLAA